MNPLIIASAISIAIGSAIGGAGGFGLAWRLQAGTITQMELDYANQRIEVARASRIALDRAVQSSAKAQESAAVRGVRIRTDGAVNRNVANRLRVTTETIVRTAASNPATCPDSTAAIATVFSQCTTAISELAEIADRHASDIQTLTESWPK